MCKCLKIFIISGALLLTPFLLTADEKFTKSHALQMIGTPKYPKDFKHFDYVNPQAPKGGIIVIGAIGAYDSLNAYQFVGIPAAGLGVAGPNLLYDSLMIPSQDEPETLYGLIAETVEINDDSSKIIFNLNPNAKFSDGQPVTAEDVLFTFQKIRDEGRLFMQQNFKRVKDVKIHNSHRIEFTFEPEGVRDGKAFYSRDLPLMLARSVVMPKHILDGKRFDKLTKPDLIGSGAYAVSRLEMGRSITYKRREDYWAKDHPTRKGMNNTDIKFEYYRDTEVAFQAFKSGEFDVWIESNPVRWHREYDISPVKEGKIIKVEYKHDRPVGMYGVVLNTRMPVFQDSRVRKVIVELFDFDTLNRIQYQNVMERVTSFFQNTNLASAGLPDADEKKLLEQLKNDVDIQQLSQPYVLPSMKTREEKRQVLKKALDDLKEAGWVLQGGKLVNQQTGNDFKFTVMVYEAEDEKIAIALRDSLKKAGITVNVRHMDQTVYWRKTHDFAFDAILFRYVGSKVPSSSIQRNRFGIKSFDAQGSLNYMGIYNPAVDAICDVMSQARTWEELKSSVKVLDRLLLQGQYVIPLFYDPFIRVAHSSKLDHPPLSGDLAFGLTSWWIKTT